MPEGTGSTKRSSCARAISTPNTLITSRKPDDLPAFCRTLVDEFAKETVGSTR